MTPRSLAATVFAAALVPFLTSGCLNLKPAEDPIRYFLLHPMAEAGEARAETPEDLRLGIAPVVVPNYLTKPWIVVRTSRTEIRYSDYDKWAENVDKGVQRVLAENLALLLHTDRVRLNSWKGAHEDLVLHLTLQRLEVDEEGQVVLEALWQISGRRAASGRQVVVLSGPAPAADPSGAVVTMSQAVAELSRTIAQAIQELD